MFTAEVLKYHTIVEVPVLERVIFVEIGTDRIILCSHANFDISSLLLMLAASSRSE